jgi:hypothetical protein
MNERELGKALLNLGSPDSADALDAQQMTRRILTRDRRRVVLLTALTLALWLLALVLVATAMIAFGLILPQQAKLNQEVAEKRLTLEERDAIQRVHLMGTQKVLVLIGLGVTILGLAALATVLLVLASRRATLRQINAQLVVISEQLKNLRLPPEGKPAGSA